MIGWSYNPSHSPKSRDEMADNSAPVVFPFNFAVPFTTRSSPTSSSASISPVADTTKRGSISRGSPYPPRSLASADLAKKGSWKSKLRQPHPFIARQPNTLPITQSNLRKNDGVSEKRRLARSRLRKSAFTPRHVILYATLVLSFIVFVLGLAYAGRVSALHSDSASTLESPAISTNKTGANELSETSTELLIRGLSTEVELDVRESLPAQDGESAAVVAENLGPFSPKATGKNATTPLSNEEAAGSSKRPSVAALFFYIATLPLATFTAVGVELIILALLASSSNSRRERSRSRSRSRASSVSTASSIDDEDFDSDADTLNGELDEKAKHIGPSDFELTARSQPKAKIEKFRPYTALVSIISTVFIAGGWVIVNAIQTHCELTTAHVAFCPAQTQHHESGSIQALSIAKLVFGWLLVVVYLSQIGFVLASSPSLLPSRLSASDVETPSTSTTASTYTPKSGGILTTTRSRSTSLRRKSVRFNLETESDQQHQQGEDITIQYIRAPSDSEIEKDKKADVKTPWQWQGSFVASVAKDEGDRKEERRARRRNSTVSNNSNNGETERKFIQVTSLAAGTINPLAAHAVPASRAKVSEVVAVRGGSHELGLASMKRSTPQPHISTMYVPRSTANSSASTSPNNHNLNRQDSDTLPVDIINDIIEEHITR